MTLEKNKVGPTFDFFRSVSVYDLSQFGIQDHQRKLIFTLKVAEIIFDSQGRKKLVSAYWLLLFFLLTLWLTHQVHLRFLQLHLLLLQLLAMKKFHAKVLKKGFRGHNDKYTQKHKSIYTTILHKSLSRTITASSLKCIQEKHFLKHFHFIKICKVSYLTYLYPQSTWFYLSYLLVDLLVGWMESQGPQKQMSCTFRWTSILQLALGCHNP